MEPCCGSGPRLRHHLCHSDAVNVEIESVSRDHSVDGRSLPDGLCRNGAVRGWYGNLALLTIAERVGSIAQ